MDNDSRGGVKRVGSDGELREASFGALILEEIARTVVSCFRLSSLSVVAEEVEVVGHIRHISLGRRSPDTLPWGICTPIPDSRNKFSDRRNRGNLSSPNM